MNRLPILWILCLAPGWGGLLRAQNCGCAEQGNCQYNFPPNSTTQVCYDITDAVNDDLADPAQGVCGVAVHFRAGRISGLELSLIAPDGTTLQLTGTSDLCDPWTPIATWDILFVPCNEPCQPDTINNINYPCQWDNCPQNDWANAFYSGKYHPFGGCLESFNSGPVNGQWCLQVANGAQFNGGSILDFEVLLCDDTGLDCCRADAGNLSFSPDVDACTGDSSLLIDDIRPRYGAIVPDPAEYGYTFIVSDASDDILDYQNPPDLRSYPAGSYKLCGLSYLLADSSNIPPPGSGWTVAALRNNLLSAAPLFCGEISTACVEVNIFEPPPPLTLDTAICEGSCFPVGDSCFAQPGTYQVELTSFAGCDSMVTLQLSILPVDTVPLTDTICEGETLFVGGLPFSEPVSDSLVQLTASTQCDSFVLLNLTVFPAPSTFLTDTICEGQSVQIGDSTYTQSGTYLTVLPTASGPCDSLVTLELTVISLQSSIAAPDTLNCAVQQVLLDGSASAQGPGIQYTWSSPDGSFAAPTDDDSTFAAAPGLYILTTSLFGCSAQDSVTVLQDTAAPLVLIAPPDTLNCAVSTVTLSAAASSGSGPLQFQWSSLGGSPVTPPDSPTPTVSRADTYRLVLTDLNNQCRDSAEVSVPIDTLPPAANPGPPVTLTCSAPTQTLDGTASSPPGRLTFSWSTTDGNILSGADTPQPTVNDDGTYQLVVQDQDNFCRDTASVLVSYDTLPPNAALSFAAEDTLTCATPTLTLDGSGSAGQGVLQYLWSGNILGGQGTPFAQVSAAGTYSLTVTDSQNGCTDSAALFVPIDTLAPPADGGPDRTLSCTVNSVQLGGTPGPGNLSYQWTSEPCGHFLSFTDTLHTRVDSACTYYLTVTDANNGCSSTDTVEVLDGVQPLLADAGPDGVLDCDNTSFTLDGSNSSSGPFVVYVWNNSAGTTLSTDPTLTVDYPDTFFLTVILAFCQAQDTAVVTLEATPPAVDAGPDQWLDCDSGQATLDGSNSDAGPDFAYQWTSPDGNVLSGTDSPIALVDEPGTYVLEVRNVSTDCPSFDTVQVFLDTAACMPFADAGADGLIDCHLPAPQWTLQATGSTGPAISYQWLALSGQVLDQSNPFEPLVTAGTFVFVVRNDAVGLFVTDTTEVAIDTVHPVVELGPGILEFNCPELAACTPLPIVNLSSGPRYVYEWTADFVGSLCTPADQAAAEVFGEGLYTLTVTDTVNGCSSSDAVAVQLRGNIPTADGGPPYQLPCSDTTATLDGCNSSQGANITYQWFSPTGNVLSGADSCRALVSLNTPLDSFFLVVTDTSNLCTDTAAVPVFEPSGCAPLCEAGAPQTLTCDRDTLCLQAEAGPLGAQLSYQWTTPDGNILSGATTLSPCVDRPGTYTLTVTRTIGAGQFTCQDEVQVLEDLSPPQNLDAGPPGRLTCADSCINLQATATTPGTAFLWQTLDGAIAAGADTPTPLVCAPGTYEVIATNPLTGCTATDFVTVSYDTASPAALILPPPGINCNGDPIALDASPSSQGPDFSYQWTATGGGVLVSGANTLQPIVNAAGTYCLRVTAANGCQATACVEVEQPDDAPLCSVVQDTLRYTCLEQVFTLEADPDPNGFPLSALSFQWTTPDGNILSGEDTPTPTVNAPGIYLVEVTNTQNNCACVSAVVVLADTIPPTAVAQGAGELNCSQPQLMLDGTASTPAGFLDYAWSLNGNALCPGCPALLVDAPGNYMLVVEDLRNGCRDTAFAPVTLNDNAPTAEAGPDTSLTCTRTSLRLDGTGSSSGTPFRYQWSTPDGNILSGAQSLQPLIDQPGWYFLQVLDTSSACTSLDSVFVRMDTLRPSPVLAPPPDSLLTCAVLQIALDGSPSGSTDSLQFQWSTLGGHFLSGTGSPQALVDSSGWYFLTLTHRRTGCTARDSLFLGEDYTPPEVSIAPPLELTCARTEVFLEGQVVGDPSNFSYQWTGPACLAGCDSLRATVGAIGPYELEVTSLNNGCSATASVLVVENTQPPTALAASLGALDCFQTTTIVSGEGSSPGDYLWTGPAGATIVPPDALQATVNAPGWYVLTVTRPDNGCSAQDSTEVIALAEFITGVALSLETGNCLDEEGSIRVDSVFGGTPPFLFALDDQPLSPYGIFQFLEPGTYAIHVEDPNGCSYDTTLTLPEIAGISVDLGADQFISLGDSTHIEAKIFPPNSLDSLQWSPLPDPDCPDCLLQGVRPLKTTTYRITVWNEAGCFASDRVTIWVDNTSPVFVPNVFSPDGDGINDRLLFFAGPEVQGVDFFRIFDRWGNLVFEAENFSPNDPLLGWDGSFQGQALDPAVFVWIAQVTLTDGRTEFLQGDVTLLR